MRGWRCSRWRGGRIWRPCPPRPPSKGGTACLRNHVSMYEMFAHTKTYWNDEIYIAFQIDIFFSSKKKITIFQNNIMGLHNLLFNIGTLWIEFLTNYKIRVSVRKCFGSSPDRLGLVWYVLRLVMHFTTNIDFPHWPKAPIGPRRVYCPTADNEKNNDTFSTSINL